MRINELLIESRDAPLYHFTSEAAFFRILVTDVLMAPNAGRMAHGGTNPTGRIYFTRDYGRQFIPAQILKGSWGFRVDQNKLYQKFGKKLKAGGQSAWSEKQRQAWLADPKNAQAIDDVKSGKMSGTLSINGADTKALVKGTSGLQSRWESEEHLDVGQVPEFHNYITGIVYAGGKVHDPHLTVDKDNKRLSFSKRGVDSQDALDNLASLLMSHFVGEAAWKQRDALIEYMTKFDIPFVFNRHDFPAKAVKTRMIELWRERKAERARREEEDKTSWVAMRNPQGGGVAFRGPSNKWKAAQQILKDLPNKFPDGIYGLSSGDEKEWFLKIYKDPKQLPSISMGAKPTSPPTE